MSASTRSGRASGCLAGVVLLALPGCGSPKHDFAEVEGKVTLNGKPLEGVVVTFYPDSDGAEQLPYAKGTTDASGVYALTSRTAQPGALVGKHRVVVSWPPKERRDDPDREPRIPIDYTVVTQTPFVFDVNAGGRQTIDLPLKK
jgi:hypothetical protein